MLVDQLLFTFRVQHYCKIIETLHHSLKLKTIGKINRNSNVFFSYLIQEYILQINIRLVHPNILLNPIVYQ